MKNIIVVILSVFLFGINNNMNAQSKTMDEFTVQVEGLGCPFCAYGLEKKFKELKGIKKVKIEMETGIMNFDYPAEKQLSIEQVERQVEKAGYTPVSVTIVRVDGNIEKTENANTMELAEGESKNIEFFVAGNCGMCKSRIEKAAKNVGGVESAEWDKETKQLVVKASKNILQSDIEKAVVKAGHDTKKMKADNSTYKELPGCCQYERVQ